MDPLIPARPDHPNGCDANRVTLTVRSLKKYSKCTYTNNGYTKTVEAVVDFNADLFKKYFDKASPLYIAEFEYEDVCCGLFVEGEIWLNRDLLKSAVDLVAKYHGFSAAIKQEHIKCNRVGNDDTKRDYSQGSLKCGCTWRIDIVALVKEQYIPQVKIPSLPGKSPYRYKKDWSQPVHIKKACTNHSGGCIPGKLNRIVTAQRGSKYIDNMPQQVLYQLCMLYEHCGKLTSSLIKNLVQPVWPSQKLITKHNVFNIKVKIRRLLPTFQKVEGDYDRFKNVAQASEFLEGIDNDVSIDDDEAYEMAQSACLEILHSPISKEEALFSFIDYLKLIQSKAKGFVFKLAEDSCNNGRKRLLGVLWKTATMRRNYELFGDYISLDMMKRAINTLLWPYFAISMLDDMKTLCIGCEGILCGEMDEMYKFACQFLKEFAPLRPLSSVLIVAGDGFFDQQSINDMGFINAHFIHDQ